METNTNPGNGPWGQFCTCVVIGHDEFGPVTDGDNCPRCVAYSDYSDSYKSVHGIRPRWAADWPVAMLVASLRGLWSDERASEPMVPCAGQGWALVTSEPAGVFQRLEAQYFGE
jgi:hypothetical protein